MEVHTLLQCKNGTIFGSFNVNYELREEIEQGKRRAFLYLLQYLIERRLYVCNDAVKFCQFLTGN